MLVLPRLFGLGITLPLIVFYADFMGLLGGALMSWAALGINIPNFLDQLQSAITLSTLWVGVVKAPFFAAIISLVGCYEGLNVTRSAESVGKLTTQSVVESIFFVIVIIIEALLGVFSMATTAGGLAQLITSPVRLTVFVIFSAVVSAISYVGLSVLYAQLRELRDGLAHSSLAAVFD